MDAPARDAQTRGGKRLAAREIAADELGAWRFAVRGELRALPHLLRSDEQVLGLAVGTIGNWRDRLFAATNQRLLVVSKSPLRSARCTEIPYERVHVSHAAPKGDALELRLVASGEEQTWNLLSAERGERFVRLLSEGSQAASATLEPAVGTACARRPAAGVRLLLSVAGLAVLVLYFADVLPREPALLAFFAVALVLTVLEWRAGRPAVEIALGAVSAAAVGLFAFEMLPFGVGAVLVTAAIAAEIAFRQRRERSVARP